MEVVHRVDERAVGADAARDDVGRAVDELREAVDDDIGAVQRGCDHAGREGVVDDEPRAVRVRDPRERRQVGDPQRRIRHRLAVEDLRARREGALDGVEVGEVDEGRRDRRLPRQEVVHERPRSAVERVARDDVVARVAALEEDARDRREPARGAVGVLGRLERRELPREDHHGRVEVAALEVAAARGTCASLEDVGETPRLEDGEGRARLDREVHASVLAELVARAREPHDGVARKRGTMGARNGNARRIACVFV